MNASAGAPRYRYVTADVFTDRRFGGNPLAVFPDARGLTTAQMAAIARELNLSETVFVLPAADPAHTRRLYIFTPFKELPFAGHPTVGTAFVLAALGELTLSSSESRIVFEEGVGAVPVLIRSRGTVPEFTQLSVAQLPTIAAPAPRATDVAALLSLDPEDLVSGRDALQYISCGVPFLLVPVRSRDALRRARPLGSVTETYLFTDDAEDATRLHARMFAPASGITEDPATGGAAACLAGYLAWHERVAPGTTGRFTIEQGADMGRPGAIEIEVDAAPSGAVTGVRVGGQSVLVGEGSIYAA